MRRSFASILAMQVGLVVGFFALWEVLTAVGVLNPFFTSSPRLIAAQLWGWISTGFIWQHIAITFYETIVAFVIAAALGILIGYVLGVNETLSRVFTPFMGIANAIPKVTLGPILILWFGVDLSSKIVLGVLIVFFIIFFNTYAGVRAVDPVLINNARVLGARKRDVAVHVLIPSALSWIFSSLQTSVGFALVGAVVAEYLSSARGIGYIIQSSEAQFNSTGVIAGFVILGGMVLLIQAFIRPIERYLLRWQPPRVDAPQTTA